MTKTEMSETRAQKSWGIKIHKELASESVLKTSYETMKVDDSEKERDSQIRC